MPPPADDQLDDRKAQVLRAVVETYIDTAQPVGSGHVANDTSIGVSSATVRNDMAVLEQEGYLVQPHTSAGRIPTDKGYRFFVDDLGGHARLRNPDAQQVRTFFARAHGELEGMLRDTTRLLADLTHHAAVVVGPPHEAATIRSVQLVGLAPGVALAVVVLSNGVVDKHTVDVTADADEDDLVVASALLAEHLVGQPYDAVHRVELPPAPGAEVAAPALAVLAQVDHGHEHVYIGGASRVASAFDAVAQVSEVLQILEQQLVVVSLLRDVLDRGLTVAIGTETGMEPLADCSVVVAPYDVDGEPAGTVGVLGPTRMDYSQALAAVAVVGRRLGQRLSEG